MQSIDLVKHQTTLLPGLEEAAHAILGRLNEARKLTDRAPLILIEDPQIANQLYRERKAQREKQIVKAWRNKKRKEEAGEARIRVAQREQDARLKARNVKTLVKRTGTPATKPD